MTALAAAPPLIAAGPVGWIILGALAVGTVAVVYNQMAGDKADESLSENDGSNCNGTCPPPAKTPEDVLSDATPDPDKPIVKGNAEQYIKPGGMPEADADFDSMQPQNVRSRGNGVRVGELNDGTRVVVRPESVPTVEINRPNGTRSIIRYK